MLRVSDDMDDLFRKAGEEYPLNTESNNFDKVLSKMNEVPGNESPETGSKKSYNTKFLFLLFLLPLGWICNQYYTPSSKTLVEKKLPSFERKQDHTLTKESVVRPGSDKSTATNYNEPGEQPLVASKRNTTVSYPTSPKQRVTNQDKSTPTSTSSTRQEASINSSNKPAADINAPGNIDQLPPSTNKDETENSIPSSNETIVSNTDSQYLQVPKVEKEQNAQSKIVKARPHQGRQIRLYGGFIGGVDISTVKYQKIQGRGYNAGVLIGYHLKKRVSVEALVMSDKKSYYTDAKYFDNSKASLPYLPALKTIEGDCKMIEAALNVKYDFKVAPKGRWFAIAGLSSYFMSGENYEYYYSYPGVPSYSRYGSYDDRSTHWLSVINLGFGYQRPVSSKITMRMEPYIKLPLTGVGIGKLPVSSSGINIAITRKL